MLKMVPETAAPSVPKYSAFSLPRFPGARRRPAVVVGGGCGVCGTWNAANSAAFCRTISCRSSSCAHADGTANAHNKTATIVRFISGCSCDVGGAVAAGIVAEFRLIMRASTCMHVSWMVAAIALVADVPPGQIVDAVTCAADPTQSYALFLPRAYTPDRAWPVILAFDPGGRGRTPVERYQAAADQYGFIVAGSNNSRNNSPEIGRAVAAMSADVLSRFRVDERRVYVAGMSGGARVAFSVALGRRITSRA